MSRQAASSAARATVESLFSDPPLNRSEVKARFEGVSRDDLRRALIDRLEAEPLPPALELLWITAIEIVKPGGMRSRLSAFVLDRSRPLAARSVALCALGASDKGEARRVRERLGEEDATILLDASMGPAARQVLDAPIPGEAFCTLLIDDHVPVAARIFDLESARAVSGRSAVDVYCRAIDEGLLADELVRLIPILGADETAAAARLLERMRDAAAGHDELREVCQREINRRQRHASPEAAEPLTGKAWVTACDGETAFTVMMVIDERRPRLPTLAMLCIRGSGGIRDAHHEREVMPRDVVDMRTRLQMGWSLVEIPLARAASLVNDALHRCEEMRLAIPKESRPVLRLVERIEAEELPPLPVVPAQCPSEEAVQLLLDAADHRESWLFDEEDMQAAGVSDPADARDLDLWVDVAALAIDSDAARCQLAAIARHESRCLAWAGREEEAADFAALALDVEARGAGASVMARAMLQFMADLHCEMEDDDPQVTPVMGDEVLRGLLREGFVARPQAPVGRDLARLDFAEVAAHILDFGLELMPPARRPGAEARREAALLVGQIVSDALTSPLPVEDRLENGDEIPEVLMDTLGLGPAEIAIMLPLIAGGCATFIREVCAGCRVRCLDTPARPVTQEFFSAVHPSCL